MSPPVEEVARSARGAGLAQHITACYKHDVMFCAELTTEQSHHYSARWCAVIRLKSIKVVWGKTRVFPHMRHITSVELSSQTVQWTVWEKGAWVFNMLLAAETLTFLRHTSFVSPAHTLQPFAYIILVTSKNRDTSRFRTWLISDARRQTAVILYVFQGLTTKQMI